MSEEWDFYFCQVDDKPASIFVDLGIREQVPIAALPHRARIHGMPTPERSPSGG